LYVLNIQWSFVRTQYSMEPTPSAISLSSTVDEMLRLYHTELSRAQTFDPLTSNRIFNIAASDAGHVILFSRLLPDLIKKAPGIQLNAIPLGDQTLISKLETGEADLAFGAYPKLYAGIHERTLYQEFYVCMVRNEYPLKGKKLSLKKFQSGRHIIVSAQGLGHIHEFIEKQIRAVSPADSVKVITHNFMVSALIAAHSDTIVTVPSGVVEALDYQNRVKVFQPPIELPKFDIKQYWHERFHRDPAHQWLRQQLVEVFSDTKTLMAEI